MRSRRSVTAILFTDIVGSTERAAELGDRDWTGSGIRSATTRASSACWGLRALSGEPLASGPVMHAERRALALCVLVLAACAGSAPPRAPDSCAGIDQPEGVVCRFYETYLETRPVGLPTPEQERALAPYLTPAVRTLMDEARAYQAAFEAEHPGEKPPFVDGTLFTSLFEGADRFEIIRSEPTASGGAVVTVRFGYDDVEPWEDAVVVIREGDRYAIDDIVSSGAGPFNPAGRLTEVLSWRE